MYDSELAAFFFSEHHTCSTLQGWRPWVAGQGSSTESQGASSRGPCSFPVSGWTGQWFGFIWAWNPSDLKNGLNGQRMQFQKSCHNCKFSAPSWEQLLAFHEFDLQFLGKWGVKTVKQVHPRHGLPEVARGAWSSALPLRLRWKNRNQNHIGKNSTAPSLYKLICSCWCISFLINQNINKLSVPFDRALETVQPNIAYPRKAVVVSSAFSVLVSTAGTAGCTDGVLWYDRYELSNQWLSRFLYPFTSTILIPLGFSWQA